MACLASVGVLLGVVLALGSSSYVQDNPRPPGAQEKPAHFGEDVEVGFDLHPKFAAVLVQVAVNNKSAVMILDTGSSRTILDPRVIDLDPRELRKPAKVGKGSGMPGDDARWGKATLQIGTHLFLHHRVVVLDMHDVSNNFQQKIDGLLGQDILCQFDRVVLDFSRSKLTLGPRRVR